MPACSAKIWPHVTPTWLFSIQTAYTKSRSITVVAAMPFLSTFSSFTVDFIPPLKFLWEQVWPSNYSTFSTNLHLQPKPPHMIFIGHWKSWPITLALVCLNCVITRCFACLYNGGTWSCWSGQAWHTAQLQLRRWPQVNWQFIVLHALTLESTFRQSESLLCQHRGMEAKIYDSWN